MCLYTEQVFHEHQYVPVGQSVTVKCHAPDTSNRVLWDYRRSVKQDVDHIYDGCLTSKYEQRCTVNNSTYDLTIHAVELFDTGEYWCIENEGFGTRHVTQLYVTGKSAVVVVQPVIQIGIL